VVAERTEPGTSSATEYRGLIQALLPRGKAWILRPEGLAYRFVTGLAAELVRVHDWTVDLIAEMDPTTSTDLLPAWERSVRLPEDGEQIAGTNAQRRLDIAAKIVARQIRTEADWVALAVAAGYAGAYVTQKSDSMCTCNSTCNAYVQGPYYDAFAFVLHMPGGTPNAQFEALCQRVKQSGVRVIFDYT